MKINWNGFLIEAVENYPKESCAFLFSRKPYSLEEEWFVFSVKNISQNPEEEWIPDIKEMQKVKSKAIKLGLVKIGNVHTHPYGINEGGYVEISKPSEKDLGFARRHNDIVRIIICCDKKRIYTCYTHDKFDNKIEIDLIKND